jgi:hypothetical protein
MEQHKRINVAIDVENELPYVLTENGTNLYFKRGMSKRRIRRLYNSLRAEQDELSPIIIVLIVLRLIPIPFLPTAELPREFSL